MHLYTWFHVTLTSEENTNINNYIFQEENKTNRILVNSSRLYCGKAEPGLSTTVRVFSTAFITSSFISDIGDSYLYSFIRK